MIVYLFIVLMLVLWQLLGFIQKMENGYAKDSYPFLSLLFVFTLSLFAAVIMLVLQCDEGFVLGLKFSDDRSNVTNITGIAVMTIFTALYFLFLEIGLFLQGRDNELLSKKFYFPSYIGQLLFTLFLGGVLLRELITEGIFISFEQFMLMLLVIAHFIIIFINRLWLKQNHSVAVAFLGVGIHTFFNAPAFSAPAFSTSTAGDAVQFALITVLFAAMLVFAICKVAHALEMHMTKEALGTVPYNDPSVNIKQNLLFWGAQGILTLVYIAIMCGFLLN